MAMSQQRKSYDAEEETITTPVNNMPKDKAEEVVKISETDTVIVVSFKLPVKIYKNPEGGWSVSSSRSILNNTLFNL